MTTSPKFRRFILDISQDLSSEDTRGLVFLAGFPSPPNGYRGYSLELLEQMLARALYRESDLAILVDLLREIGRQDLAAKCLEYERTLPLQCVSELNRQAQASPSISLSSHSSWEELSSPPTTPTSLTIPVARHHNPLSRSTSKLCRLGQRMAHKIRKRQHAPTGSCDEGLDSFLIVEKGDLTDYPDHTHQSHTHGALECSQSFDSTLHRALLQAPSRGRSRTIDSEDSGISMSPVGPSPAHSTTSTHRTSFVRGLPTFSWPLKRHDFMVPLFMHSNKPFEKKFQVRAGAKESGFVLTFVLKLYPNGVNWDQDSSASLHVEVVPSSKANVSSNVYFGVSVVEDRSTSRNILTQRRKICRLREGKEFLFDGFLPHEVVKMSEAKLFYVLFYVEVSYLLGEDWVYIGTESCLGCLQDVGNLWEDSLRQGSGMGNGIQPGNL